MADALPKLGIGIEINLSHGWGIHAFYLARQILAQQKICPVAICGQADPILPGGNTQHAERPSYPIIHGRGNHPGMNPLWPFKQGDSLIQVLEDTALTPQDIVALKEFESHLITLSNWNATVLKAHGIDSQCTPLGVNTQMFKPAPRTEMFGADRFVVFSGGKLELRKGQDIVLAAFKVFQERHPDALLVTMWHNHWPETSETIGLSPYWKNDQTLVKDHKDVGLIKHSHLADLMSSFDVALFPNRCEGGTNMVAMECLAAGVPTVLSNGHGHFDLIQHPVPCFALTEMRPCTFRGANEHWVEPDLEEVIEGLEYIYTNRAVARATGLAAAMTMQTDWDWPTRMDAQIEALGISGGSETVVTNTHNDELAKEYAILAGQLRNAGHRKSAVSVAKRALRIAPKYAEVVQQYGNLLLTDHQPHAALEFCARAGKLSGNQAVSTVHNMGLAYLYAGQNESALREFNKAAGTNLEVGYDRAHCLLAMGRWKEGLPAIELRRLHKPDNYRPKKCQEWQGEQTGTLWVTTEQGIGDAFMFSRFLPWARSRCERLIFSTHAQTIPLFQDYPGVDEIRLFDPLMSEPTADAHAPLLSLANFFDLTPNNIPPDPGHFLKVAAQVGANLTAAPGAHKIGLVWAGNSTHLRDWERSIPLGEFLPLIENPKLQLFSLQVGSRAKDLNALGLGQIVADLSDKLVAWPVTAAVLRGLDALVTCDTAVAHLAGVLGVPTYLLLCKVADWRWLQKRPDTPWYPSVKLIRQKRLGCWGQPISTVAEYLNRLLP